MKNPEEIRQFLGCVFFGPEKPLELDLLKGRYPFVTISRQVGAGGRTLAFEIARQMERKREPFFSGWQVFDQEILKRILEDPRLKSSSNYLMNEEYRSQVEDILFNLFEGQTPQDVIVHKIFQLIRGVASYGKVILIGRAGSCVTRSLPAGVHVRLVASEKARVRRIMQLMKVDEKSAQRIVREWDESRARLVKDYFGKEIDDPLLYDAVWNSDTVPMETIAAAVLDMVQRKAAILTCPPKRESAPSGAGASVRNVIK